MIVFKKAAPLTRYLEKYKCKQQVVGFVPTMGALHEGHLSLIRHCRNENDVSVCSIFINPTQFNDVRDFEEYPVSIAEDILKLVNLSCDILFLPSVNEIYPNGTAPGQVYDIGHLETTLEGKFRPGHFQGVCQVVDRLLNIIAPDKLYLGQKDFQQCKVIERLIETLSLPIKVVKGKTIREATGLAMSSRNMRLNNDEKQKALSIYQSLQFINEHFKQVPVSEIKLQAETLLLKNGITKVDYVEIADERTLEIVDSYDANKNHIALVAAYLGEVRLIDNMLLNHA